MKIRKKPAGRVSQVTLFQTNGVTTSTSVGASANISTLERLEISRGHPYKLLSTPKRKPRKPKPYKGKNPAKIQGYYSRLARYKKKLLAIKYLKQADIGGAFQMRSIIPFPALKSITDRKFLGGNSWQICTGTYSATNLSHGSNITIAPSTDSELNAAGTILMSRALPTNPLVNMGQFLVELRDLPRVYNPLLWEKKMRFFKKLALGGSSEYLNVQFGWRPFIEDINDFFKETSRMTRQIQKFDAGSGKHIRRTRQFPAIETTTNSTIGTGLGPFPTPSTLVSGGTLYKTVITSKRIWFKGAFTYYLPPLDGSTGAFLERYGRYANKLFGIRPTPDLLWKVTPWTWAIDWMSSSGAIIRNWDAFHNQGLVLHYGYVMETKQETTLWNLAGFRLSSQPLSHMSDLSTQKSLVRRRATPYGFGANPASFTPFQNGIIAALGINRAGRWL